VVSKREGVSEVSTKNTDEIQVPDELIRPTVELLGRDGNAGAIMATVARALRKAGNSREVIDSYREQSMAGDYDHLLRVAMEFAEVE
jgi:hypothetical protein